MDSWAFFSIRALMRLALDGRGPPGFSVGLTDRLTNKGDISPLEDAVFARLGRVWQALKEGGTRMPHTTCQLPDAMH